jgi:dTDP-4-amino-4,6-dideoxygalactose transaminase
MVIFIDEEKARTTRDEIYHRLKERGIQTKRYFYPALHMQKAYTQYRERYQGRLPIAERASREGLALPLYGHMGEEEVLKVCEELRRIL